MHRYRVPGLDSDGKPVMAGVDSKTRLRKMVFGGYPAVSLKEARRSCQEQKSLTWIGRSGAFMQQSRPDDVLLGDCRKTH